MELKDLVGEHELSGVDSGILKADRESYQYEDASTLLFILDGKTYRVTEDPSDGYRSMMRDIEEVSDAAVANRFAPVRVMGIYREESCDILELHDLKSGNLVLRIGTENTDDYYPYFVSEFMPERMACNQPG